jgi:hypothetical protein
MVHYLSNYEPLSFKIPAYFVIPFSVKRFKINVFI